MQYVSVITLAEIQKGIELLDRGRRRSEPERWLDQDLSRWFSGRSLTAQGQRTGRTLPAIDSLIAATALEHSLVVVTRNVRDFRSAGLEVFDPWLE